MLLGQLKVYPSTWYLGSGLRWALSSLCALPAEGRRALECQIEEHLGGCQNDGPFLGPYYNPGT